MREVVFYDSAAVAAYDRLTAVSFTSLRCFLREPDKLILLLSTGILHARCPRPTFKYSSTRNFLTFY